KDSHPQRRDEISTAVLTQNRMRRGSWTGIFAPENSGNEHHVTDCKQTTFSAFHPSIFQPISATILG
ncbi:MAG: hypothetical protein ACRD4T_10785, partial [Candidatus Acidiferrales bacterium]